MTEIAELRQDVRSLILPLKREYFEAIRDGSKTEEYRVVGKYWRTRLEGKTFDRLILMLGYPAFGDRSRRITLPWRGYTIKTITHPHFGPNPVEVYAIKVAP